MRARLATGKECWQSGESRRRGQREVLTSGAPMSAPFGVVMLCRWDNRPVLTDSRWPPARGRLSIVTNTCTPSLCLSVCLSLSLSLNRSLFLSRPAQQHGWGGGVGVTAHSTIERLATHFQGSPYSDQRYVTSKHCPPPPPPPPIPAITLCGWLCISGVRVLT